MCAPKMPAPPDPAKTAAAQTGTNISTAIANQSINSMDQTGPYGSITYKRVGQGDLNNKQQARLDRARSKSVSAKGPELREMWGNRYDKLTNKLGEGGAYSTVVDGATGQTYYIPKMKQVTELSPQQETLANVGGRTQENLARMANRQTRRIDDLLSNEVSFDGVPDIKYGNKARNEAEAALMARMNPQLDSDRAALEARLVNQGVTVGSEAWKNAMRQQGQSVNDARMAAILGAGTEADRMFNQSMGARQQGVTEALALRNQPINEISALMSGSQVSMPTFGSTPQSSIPTTDYAGLINQNWQQRAAQAQQQGAFNQQMLGGLFGLAGAGIYAA